jgi:hypothetical protein
MAQRKKILMSTGESENTSPMTRPSNQDDQDRTHVWVDHADIQVPERQTQATIIILGRLHKLYPGALKIYQEERMPLI